MAAAAARRLLHLPPLLEANVQPRTSAWLVLRDLAVGWAQLLQDLGDHRRRMVAEGRHPIRPIGRDARQLWGKAAAAASDVGSACGLLSAGRGCLGVCSSIEVEHALQRGQLVRL